MKEDENNDLPWMSEDIKKTIEHRDKIVKEQDINGLFQLADNSDFSIALSEIINNRCDYNPDRLNNTQRVLFLCMRLVDAGQADHILSFLQEEYSQWKHEAVNALKEIGAIKSAEIIRQAIDLLPENNEWFFDTADEHSEKLMNQHDRDFSNYPDGSMPELYRKYAEKNRNDL